MELTDRSNAFDCSISGDIPCIGIWSVKTTTRVLRHGPKLDENWDQNSGFHAF